MNKYCKIALAAAWSAVEAKYDMDIIMAGHRVPLFKNKDNGTWITDIQNLSKTKDNSEFDKNPTAFGYDDYLRIYLLFQDEDTTLGKIKDMIYVNMKAKNVDVNKCFTTISVDTDVSINRVLGIRWGGCFCPHLILRNRYPGT